ncbi:MAG TPA: hypothetical protein VE823_22620 [Geodermatophilus sp.]|nr:hypothetical protein [Geodermatophilus sp.]
MARQNRCRAQLLRAGVRRGLAGITEARVCAELDRMTPNAGVSMGGDSPVARPTASG